MVVRQSLKMSLFMSCLSAKTTDDFSHHEEKPRKISSEQEEEHCVSEEEVQQWCESFEKVIASYAGRRVFREFLRSEFSEENLLFWQACEDLKKEEDPKMIEEKARLVYEDYISIISPREVSLDSRVRDVINKNMASPSRQMFDEAQIQIYTLMQRDSYPRFLNSQTYRQLLR